MIRFEHTEVVGWEHAIRGMRNPKNSWNKSDSYWTAMESANTDLTTKYQFFVGENDLALMKTLRDAGSDHRKYLRMLTVYVDITAPLYWWKEFDTYKVGTVANSCSTMHTIHKKEFTLDDFSHEHLIEDGVGILSDLIYALNEARDSYLYFDDYYAKGETSEELTCKKDVWWQMIQLLPTSYNQKRSVMLNYEVLANIYHARKAHKLNEWLDLCRWVEDLPYSELITG